MSNESKKIPFLMKGIFGFLSEGKHMPRLSTWTLFSNAERTCEEENNFVGFGVGNLARTFCTAAAACKGNYSANE